MVYFLFEWKTQKSVTSAKRLIRPVCMYGSHNNLEIIGFQKFIWHPNWTRPDALSNFGCSRNFFIQLFPSWTACSPVTYIEDITCLCVDTNFIFGFSTRYRVEHEKIKLVSTRGHVIFCLLYKHTNEDVFDDFPKIFEHFWKIAEDSSKSCPKARRTLPDIYRKCPEITKDSRR